MDESKYLDKIKMKEILDELANLKTYSKDLSNNTRGEKLENYINELAKNISVLNDKVEEVYDNTLKTSE